MSTFIVAISIQGFATIFDEFYFHRQRDLPRWERIGHPLDSLSVLLCLLFLALAPRNPTTEVIYGALAIASCVCVTKDEWVHHKLCSSTEMWLHSVLFILHPIVLFTAMNAWEDARPHLLAAAGVVFTFMTYQIIYWSVVGFSKAKTSQQGRYKELNEDDLYEYFGE